MPPCVLVVDVRKVFTNMASLRNCVDELPHSIFIRPTDHGLFVPP